MTGFYSEATVWNSHVETTVHSPVLTGVPLALESVHRMRHGGRILVSTQTRACSGLLPPTAVRSVVVDAQDGCGDTPFPQSEEDFCVWRVLATSAITRRYSIQGSVPKTSRRRNRTDGPSRSLCILWPMRQLRRLQYIPQFVPHSRLVRS
jgi:hypothetical protein